MSRSYRKNPIMRYEKPDFSHKEKNRFFRRKSKNLEIKNGNSYKKYIKDWSWHPCLFNYQQARQYYNSRQFYDYFKKSYPTEKDYIIYWKKICLKK